MNPQKPKTVRITRRIWPVAKPCDCPACRSIRLQIQARHQHSSTPR